MLKRYPLLALAVILLAAYTGVTTMPYGTNQILAHGDVKALVNASTYYWSSDPGWTTSDGQGTTFAEFTAHVGNTGCTAPTGNTGQLITRAQADACKYTPSSHSPILANPSFASGATAWTWNNSGCASNAAFNSAAAEDGDSWLSRTQSLAAAGTCTSTTSQSVTLTAPIGVLSASLTFWYDLIPAAYSGDAIDCPANANGSASVALKVNGTSVSIGALTADSAWHSVTVPISLINGTNSIEFDATDIAAENVAYDTGLFTCKTPTYTQSSTRIDNTSVTSTY